MSHAGDETQWLLSGELPCLGCRYNLRGLVGPVVKCPECGHANDLRDPTPWRRTDLPLGVREREHWPALAVVCSLVTMPPVAALAGAAGNGNLQLSFGFAMVTFVFATVWGVQCWRWVRSALRPVWASMVLGLTHLSAWAVIGGIVGIVADVARAMTTRPWQPGWLALAAVGVGGIFYARRLIASADRERQFRADWRDYRLPVVDEAR